MDSLKFESGISHGHRQPSINITDEFNNSHVDCIGMSNNLYTKVNPFCNEGIDWERRENVLARLLNYDTNYQTSINHPNQLLVLTEDELRMRD